MEHLLGIDLVSFIRGAGYLGLALVVFAESGLFFGFLFPGDSLLFTAGFLASQGYFSIGILVPLLFLSAILGDQFGYAFGRRVGPALFRREDSRFFKRSHLERAHVFYKEHGASTIVLARFVPVVRTFAPIVAGASRMHYGTFLIYNLLGGVPWAVGLTLAGYVFGNIIPNPDHYVLPVVLVIIVLSMLPALYKTHKIRKKTREFQ